MSRIARTAHDTVRDKTARQQVGEAFAGHDRRRETLDTDRRARPEPEPVLLGNAELLDEGTDEDIDWYALSNGLSTVMPDGTRIEGFGDDD